MKLKIAVLSDLHYSETSNILIPERHGNHADIFLLRAVHRINRFLKPDIVLILGDIINDPIAPGALDCLERLRKITDLLEMPFLIIPGNHDPAPDVFYKVFPRPPEVLDLKGCRFISFLDREEPGYNASRSKDDIVRMINARCNFKGDIIALQHVPVFVPGTHSCPYNYTNAEEIISVMKEQNIMLAVSGHYHTGFDIIRSDNVNFSAVPAFCETPFRFMVITVENGQMRSEYQQLKMPEEYALIDYHVHTSLAYCNENMTMEKAVEFGKLFGLEKLVFSEHSGHLYFDRAMYGSDDFCNEGISSKNVNSRMQEYFEMYRKFNSNMTCLGIEIDYDFNGRPVIKPDDWKKMEMSIGAIHYLKELKKTGPDIKKAADEFLFISEKILKSGIKILAHPFRVFRRAGQAIPDGLFEKLSSLLYEYGASPEINYHTNTPELEFFKLCLNKGIKPVLGSDSHNLYEIGEFFPHLDFLKNCGFNGNPKDILLKH